MPIRIQLREHFACWGWLIDVKKERVALFTRTAYRKIEGMRNVVEYCAAMFPATFTNAQIDDILNDGISVSWGGNVVPWSGVPKTLTPYSRQLEMMEGVADALCHDLMPQVMPPSSSASRSYRTVKRACTRSSPKKGVKRAASPMLVDSSPTKGYDLRSIGGTEVDVRDAHASRHIWDRDIVMELFRHGARPPLKEIKDVVQREHYRDAECIFIQPSGVETESIFVPMSIILTEYRDMVEQYVR